MIPRLFLFSMAIALAGAAGADVTLDTAVVSGSVRVRPEGPVDGQAAARISAARNESESFQIIVTPAGGNADKVTAGIGSFTNGEHSIDPAHCTLYRAVYVPVRHSAPRATEAPGWFADALVPFVNPYSGEAVEGPVWTGQEVEGARYGGVPFGVWEGRYESIWVDVHVPKDTPAGTYTGAVRVSADNAESVEVPVELEVWDFALPDGPTHENHFGGFGSVAAYWDLKSDDAAFHKIEDRFIAMAADNRINPPLPQRLQPTTNDDGSVVFDEDLDRRLSAFVDAYHLTNFEIHRAFNGDAPEDQAKRERYYQSWYAYLEMKGWADRAYIYMFDEPNTLEQYDEVRKIAAQLEAAEPRLRRLVVEQTYTHDPAWGTLNDAIDIWCPLLGFIDEETINQMHAEGDDVWSYTALVQTAPPYHPQYETVKNDLPPFWEIDHNLLAYRIAPWVNWRYNITGFLYWSSVYWGSPDRNPWQDPGFRVRWNGEGFLFYPGKEVGIDGPIASIRLKNVRDGMEDYEYFALLAQKAGKDVADGIVREAVPTWGDWEQDSKALENLRRRLAEEILAHN